MEMEMNRILFLNVKEVNEYNEINFMKKSLPRLH